MGGQLLFLRLAERSAGSALPDAPWRIEAAAGFSRRRQACIGEERRCCMMLRDHLLQRATTRLSQLGLPLELVLWNGMHIALAPDTTVTLKLHRRGVLRQLLLGDLDGLGRSYVEGALTVSGRLRDILGVGIVLAERIGRMAWLTRLAARRPRRRHTRQADATWVGQHYDVSNEFYALWLDRRMVYSCAYFKNGDEDIDTAQAQKLDHLCRKLRLRPGERLLDIGCGWGGLLAWAAARYGVTGVGITVSREQHAYANARLATEGLDGRVEVRLEDYRDLAGEAVFDKIVSVGMYEHVGRANLPLYFRMIHRLLRPGGIALNHGITAGDTQGRSLGRPGGRFIEQYVFPGGELPHLSEVVREMARQELEVLDVECLRPHYAQTLLHWLQRLEGQRARATELAGIERYRIWRIYLAGCALAFERGWVSVHQVVVGKPDARGRLSRPWTRRHQYVADDPALMAGAADWAGL
jgi:cyclopropane-fatty-acyl-phospholipid synthase